MSKSQNTVHTQKQTRVKMLESISFFAKNYITSDWLPDTDNWEYSKESGLTISAQDEDFLLRVPIDRDEIGSTVQTTFKGNLLEGNACVLYIVDRFNRILAEQTLNSTCLSTLPEIDEYALLIKVFANSTVNIAQITLKKVAKQNADAVDAFLRKNLRNRIAVIVPTYPTFENRYLCAFVHARVRAYAEAGVKCDVICAFDYENYCHYKFEGISVMRMPLDSLPHALKVKKYEKVLMHFFDDKFAEAIKPQATPKTSYYIWSHGPETMYWDWPVFTTPYFQQPQALTEGQTRAFEKRDELIRELNALPNVTWVFVSPFLKSRSEELIGITFNSSHVIPNVIDETVFPFRKKDPDLRKKIFVARKFDNVNKYGLDLVAQCIVELSKREFFSELEFNIFGAGNYFHELTAHIADFPNVNLHQRFLTREEIAEEHGKHGIALFPTRWDSQGVSMGEAAMSGLAVVSSSIESTRYFLPDDCGLLAENIEDPKEYADIITRLVLDPDYFVSCSQSCYQKAYQTARKELTIDKEIKMISRKFRH